MILGVGIGNASNAGTRITLGGLAPFLKIHSDYGVAEEYKRQRPELKIIGRWVLESDDDWRAWADNPRGFYEHYFRHHVLANRAIQFWNTGTNEDSRKLFDNADYQRLKASGNQVALGEWLERNYYSYVPNVDRRLFPNSESPDYPDLVMRASFEAELSGYIFADGAAPVIWAFGVGNPSGSTAEQLGAWRASHAALAAAKRYGGLADLHVYFNVPGADGPVNTLITHMANTNTVIPIVFGETGSEPGYKKRGREEGYTSEQYATDLVAFDNDARARWPGAVIAMFIFQANLPGWEDFEIEGNEAVINRVIAHGQATYQQPDSRVVGLDVSIWQDDDSTPRMMDWAKAKARGAEFVFVRASAGSIADSDYAANVEGALRVGMLVGAYHYLSYSVDPRVQAALFWEKVKQFPLRLPPVADIEQDPFPVAWGGRVATEFLQEIERLSGRVAMIYTRAEYWNRTLVGLGLEAGRPLWVASYRNDAPLLPRGWGTWEFWQFTSRGNGPEWGAESTFIDLNTYNGTAAQLRVEYGTLAEPILMTYAARDRMEGTFYNFYRDPQGSLLPTRLSVKWDMHVRERRVVAGVEWLRVTDKASPNQLWMKVGA